MTGLVTEVHHNEIIDAEGQPRDGMIVVILDEDSGEMVDVREYDYSWSEKDACADACDI